MNRPCYILAQGCRRADEAYFHRYNLATRLIALAAGGEISLHPVMVAGRGARAGGWGLRVNVIEPGGDRQFLAYVFRDGIDVIRLQRNVADAIAVELGEKTKRRAA